MFLIKLFYQRVALVIISQLASLGNISIMKKTAHFYKEALEDKKNYQEHN